MTEQTNLAAKVHEILSNRDLRDAEMIAEIKAMLPTPSRPSLEDMTEDEREACRWMQADVEAYSTRCVIVNSYWNDGNARVMWPGGFIELADWKRVTPRPDLPRLEFPGDKKPAPAPALPGRWRLADHPEYGRIIVTTPASNRDRHVYFVLPDDDDTMGYDWHVCDHADLTFLDTDQEGDQ